MIAKSFELWVCNSSTFANIRFIRNVACVWADITAEIPALDGVPSAVAARIDAYTDDRAQLLPVVRSDANATTRSLLQAVYNGVLFEDTSLASGELLKLIAGNGSFAVVYSGVNDWKLYDKDGNYIGDTPFSVSKNKNVYWQAIVNLGSQFTANTTVIQYKSVAPVINQQSLSIIKDVQYSINAAVAAWLNAVPTHLIPPDPFTPGDEGDIDGPSGPGGGGGDHDTTSDPIDVPTLPTTSAVDTGFITLFNPSLSEIRALADYMWNGLFDINNLRKLFADPMDVILGLSIVPGPVPSGAQEAVSIGNISTGVMMTKASDQFFTVDCGTLKPTEFWGAYLDYSPYTKVDIYLPFIGMRSLSIDDVMEKNVNVVYHVDILSGACVAFIKSGDQVLYTHIGQCAASIPINGNDWTNTINGILSMATAIAGTVATGGAAAPMLMSQAANLTNILKPTVARSGGMGGMGGMLGIQKPYLILTRPRQCVPGNQNIYKGYPAFMTRALGDLSGMTSVEDIHLAVSGATQEELEEIERLLKEGVLL